MSKTFYQKLYHWSMNEAINEARSEFFRLSQMNCSGVNGVIWTIDLLGLNKQEALNTLVKVNYKYFLDITVSEQEESCFKKIMEIAQSRETRPMEKEQTSQLVSIGKRKIKQLIRQSWMEEFGTKIPANLYFETKINDFFEVATFLDCEKEFCNYFHHVFLIENTKNAKTKITLGPVNLPRCLGMYADAWCFLSEENAVASIRQIVSYCKDFINYAPHLVSGLEKFAEV